jgi:hypothetical protein
LPDEACGIWGQTYHGSVHEGMFTVMYPSRDERGFGTLSVARRPWDQPHSDGFTFSGHEGPALALLLREYQDFALDAEFTLRGTVELAFDYCGILGPDHPRAGAVPSQEALADYKALRISEGKYALISVSPSQKEKILAKGRFPFSEGENVSARLRVEGDTTRFEINGAADAVSGLEIKGGCLALISHESSIMTCSKFSVAGEAFQSTLKYNAYDALLGAGQKFDDWQPAESQKLRCASAGAMVGSGDVYGKWNVVCCGVTLYSPKGPGLGKARVVIDGEYMATVDLYSEQEIPSAPVYTCDLESGRHCVAVYPESGSIALDVLAADSPI